MSIKFKTMYVSHVKIRAFVRKQMELPRIRMGNVVEIMLYSSHHFLCFLYVQEDYILSSLASRWGHLIVHANGM